MKQKNTLRPLGRTQIRVTPVGLGCWQFSKNGNLAGKFWPDLDDHLIERIVSLSIVGGINWFDTAEVYGRGASEKALSAALQAAGKGPGDVIIATKWWPMFRFASSIRSNIHSRIRALAPFPVDLFQVHQPFGFSDESSEMRIMSEIFEGDLIRAVGVSNFPARKMENAWKILDKKGIPLASNQMPYSLLDRKIESNGVLERAKELGITIIAYSPLAQGLLTGKFHDHPELLDNIGFRKYTTPFKPAGLRKSLPVVNLVKELAVKYQASPAQIALNWLLHFHGEAIVVIPGATREEHVKENTRAMSFRLSEEDMDKLDRVSSVFKHP